MNFPITAVVGAAQRSPVLHEDGRRWNRLPLVVDDRHAHFVFGDKGDVDVGCARNDEDPREGSPSKSGGIDDDPRLPTFTGRQRCKRLAAAIGRRARQRNPPVVKQKEADLRPRHRLPGGGHPRANLRFARNGDDRRRFWRRRRNPSANGKRPDDQDGRRQQAGERGPWGKFGRHRHGDG